MKIEIIPAHTHAYSRKTQLKTETDNAVDLDPEKSRSGTHHKHQRDSHRDNMPRHEELPTPSNAIKDNSRIHVVA